MRSQVQIPIGNGLKLTFSSKILCHRNEIFKKTYPYTVSVCKNVWKYKFVDIFGARAEMLHGSAIKNVNGSNSIRNDLGGAYVEKP